MSKIGKINIAIPEKVKVILNGDVLNIEGPLGKKSLNIDLDIFNLEMRISNQDNDKLEYTIGFFSRDSQTFTNADLDVSMDNYEVAPHIFKPLVGFEYKTPHQACLAEKASPGLFAAKPNVITCMGIPLDNKTEAYFANFKYNMTEKTFIQFGFREQEMIGYRAQNLYLPVTALVTAATGGGLTIPRIPINLQNSN